MDGRGGFTTRKVPNWTIPCPDTHFKCLSIELCMPVYLRCNGVNDCPELEDEEGCDNIGMFPGFYGCRGFMNTFLHPDHLCDGWPQCPQHDDERFCDLPCAAQCSCLGHSWFCRQIFQARLYPRIKFLDARKSGMKPVGLTYNTLLIHLSLSQCGIVDFKPFTLPNLHSLDVDGNRIRVITETDLKGLPALTTLFLSRNPLTSLFSARSNLSFPKLTRLDLSNVKIRWFNTSVLASFRNLQTLNLSDCGIENMSDFKIVPKLRVLDTRGCPISHLSTGMLKPLTRLRTVRADNFKVCCPVTLPDGFHLNDCESPEDKISSCDDLFKSNLHRVSWHSASFMALVCNVAILFKRLKGRPRPSGSMPSCQKPAVDVFLTNLFVCCFIHAVYMVIISAADVSYRGNYVLKDIAWKNAPLCAAAGFLWLLSMEISLFLVGLITLDRVLLLWCPRTSGRFFRKSAVAAICLVVAEGFTIALVPLLPPLSRRKLFQQTALCSPLLFASQKSPGGHYIFGVFSVFNVVVSWLAGLGQLSVYFRLHRTRFAFVQSPNQTKELSTCRRVMAPVLCDIIYWLVLGHTSQLTAAGMTVSDNVVLLQVLVMPYNWTLKPVLYAIATLLEQRRQQREERLLKMLIAKRHD